MKFATLSTPFLFHLIKADKQNLQTQLDNIATHVAKQNNPSVSSETTDDAILPLGEGERALLQVDMGLLNRYGCWCYFEEEHGTGRGRPVDEIDQICKTLHDGYTCIEMDAADRNIECIPWEVPYNSAFGSGIPSGLTMSGIVEECDRQNTPDSCESWTCKVEGWFAQSYFTYAAHGGLINPAHMHSNGFDPKQDCPIQTGIKSERQCCNDYPVRFPYKTYGGSRSCCYGHTYNTGLYSCCDDGHVRITCP